MVFNNTNNGGEFKPELELESPTIGYRSNDSIGVKGSIRLFAFVLREQMD